MNGLVVSTEKVIRSEQDGIPLIGGGKKMLVVARWKIKLGIDAEKIKLETDEANRTIEATLPPVTVTSTEQVGTPQIYDQRGSILDHYSPQDVLDAVNKKSETVKKSVLEDSDYQTQTLESIKNMISTMINSAPGVEGHYKIVFVTAK